jgi:transcriptional regulator with XRE-family HTH domain
MKSRLQSKDDPLSARSVRTLAMDAWRRAEGMGLVEAEASPLDEAGVSRLLQRVRDAGIARGPALRFDNVELPSVAEAEALLRFVIAALDASPTPRFEWPAVSRVIEVEQLASLLNVSASSLKRYASGERDTPDEVAARLHHVALIIGDLAGAYNEVGVRRWFERKRTALDNHAPAALLSGDWNPDDPKPQKVRDLARALVALGAT